MSILAGPSLKRRYSTASGSAKRMMERGRYPILLVNLFNWMLPSFSRIYRHVFKTSRVSGPCPVTNSRPAAIYIYWIGRQKITRLAALCWNIRQLWVDSGPTDGRNVFFFLIDVPAPYKAGPVDNMTFLFLDCEPQKVH